MEGDQPFSLINPFARCLRFPKLWSNNPSEQVGRCIGDRRDYDTAGDALLALSAMRDVAKYNEDVAHALDVRTRTIAVRMPDYESGMRTAIVLGPAASAFQN